MYRQRTPVENPYCGNQFADGEPIEAASWSKDRGLCPQCGRYVNLRRNGTAKLHKVYGRRQMAQRVAEYKRTGSL